MDQKENDFTKFSATIGSYSAKFSQWVSINESRPRILGSVLISCLPQMLIVIYGIYRYSPARCVYNLGLSYCTNLPEKSAYPDGWITAIAVALGVSVALGIIAAVFARSELLRTLFATWLAIVVGTALITTLTIMLMGPFMIAQNFVARDGAGMAIAAIVISGSIALFRLSSSRLG